MNEITKVIKEHEYDKCQLAQEILTLRRIQSRLVNQLKSSEQYRQKAERNKILGRE